MVHRAIYAIVAWEGGGWRNGLTRLKTKCKVFGGPDMQKPQGTAAVRLQGFPDGQQPLLEIGNLLLLPGVPSHVYKPRLRELGSE